MQWGCEEVTHATVAHASARCVLERPTQPIRQPHRLGRLAAVGWHQRRREARHAHLRVGSGIWGSRLRYMGRWAIRY